MPDIARLTTAEILSARGAKNAVDRQRPYAFLVEDERSATGEVVPIATLFLINRECPYRCLMCDLWQNTTDQTIPPGSIPAQIDYALERLLQARQIKLYNSGNFFDPQAIPRDDYSAIIERVRQFENVIVENHPGLTNDACVVFRDQLGTQLEVALGLETIHPQVLPALNKQMTVADFDAAVRFLSSHGIAVRAFILLRPPYLTEDEGAQWAIRSIEHAFSVGVGCCSVIATRGGNGIMERLQAAGSFAPPTLRSLEAVLTAGIEMQAGRIFADLWGAEQFSHCLSCGPARVARMRRMNLTQTVEPEVVCDCGT